MPENDSFIGQVKIEDRWVNVFESDDEAYVIHCLNYKTYDDKPKRIVKVTTYDLPDRE